MTAPADTVSTPTLGALLRRGRLWAVLLALVAVGTVLLTVATGAPALAPDLDVDSAAPDGSRAVAQVLREEGVEVERADDLDAALGAAGSRAVLLVDDADAVLDEQQYADLADAFGSVVLVRPSATALDALLPGVASAGVPLEEGSLDADCGLRAAVRAGAVPAGGQAYRIVEGAASGCFPTGDDAFSLVTGTSPRGADVAVLGDADVLRNGTIDEQGRAALAVNLLGAEESLVWYRVGFDDLRGEAAVDPSDLAPGWVTPAILLLLAVGVVAAVWRGRRFGPLAVEPLPVVVHASETARGRARLYARGSTRVRALDALRIGTLRRVASMLGLSASAGVDEIVSGTAELLGSDPVALRRLLVEDEPADDASLVRASDDLLRLESAVRAALAPTPHPVRRQEGTLR